MNAILPFQLKLQFCFRAKWEQMTFMKPSHTASGSLVANIEIEYIQKA